MTWRKSEKHIEVTPSGYRAHIRIDGELHRQRFRKSTPLIKVKQWLLTVEMKHRGKTPKKTGKFCDDARVYLETVKAMPSYADRKRHIDEWIAVFGDRERSEITADDIRAVLATWRTEPRTITYTRRATDKPPRTRTVTLSASAVNKRRTALMHLFRVLDGKAEPNPVRDVPKYREPAPLPKGIPYTVLRELFRGMRDTATTARLMMLAYTGIPHAQLAQITAADVDLEARTIRVPGRKKGAGTRARIVPLTADGVRACRAMTRTGAWGPFSRSSLHKAFRRACKAVPALAASADQLTPYDLRHSFGTEVYRSSGDIRATQILMDHSTPTLTHRYTLGAIDARVAAAVASVNEQTKVPRRSAQKKRTRKKKR